MATRLIKDHHSLTRNLKLNDNYISNDGGDEGISINDSGTALFTNTTKTASGNIDYSLRINETLNLGSGEAALGDTHYGLMYVQTQTDIDGWNDVYLMYLQGGGDKLIVDDSANLVLQDDAKVIFGDAGEHIKGTGTHLVLTSSAQVQFYPGDVNAPIFVSPTSKTSSSTTDSTITLGETLNLSSGAGGSDIHYGIRYFQTQTNIAGWDEVYLMHLLGGSDIFSIDDSAKTYIASSSLDSALVVDHNYSVSGDNAGIKSLSIDYDNTGSNSSNFTEIALDINAVHGSSSGGVSSMYGQKIYVQLTAASGLGQYTGIGLAIECLGNTTGAIDIVEGLTVKATGGDTNRGIQIRCQDGGEDIRIYSTAHESDDFKIKVAGKGATTFTTLDSGGGAGDGTEADFIIDADGSIDLNSVATKDITLDSGGFVKLDAHAYAEDEGIQFLVAGTHVGNITGHHTATNLRLYENIGASTDDYFNIGVAANGSTIIKTVDAAGADGHMAVQADGHVKFECPAGFTQVHESFSDDSIIGSGGTDDTHIDFRISNKMSTAVTGNITNLNLIFPAVSGNFLLLLTYDGDHTITNYKVYEADESAADGDADVLWAGGTKPDNTASGVDILSFYYNATSGSDKCYGVASLAFATP